MFDTSLLSKKVTIAAVQWAPHVQTFQIPCKRGKSSIQNGTARWTIYVCRPEGVQCRCPLARWNKDTKKWKPVNITLFQRQELLDLCFEVLLRKLTSSTRAFPWMSGIASIITVYGVTQLCIEHNGVPYQHVCLCFQVGDHHSFERRTTLTMQAVPKINSFPLLDEELDILNTTSPTEGGSICTVLSAQASSIKHWSFQNKLYSNIRLHKKHRSMTVILFSCLEENASTCFRSNQSPERLHTRSWAAEWFAQKNTQDLKNFCKPTCKR